MVPGCNLSPVTCSLGGSHVSGCSTLKLYFLGALRLSWDGASGEAASTFNGAMTTAAALEKFLDAHDRYLALDDARTSCSRPAEREQMHIAILQAYLEVQYRAKLIAGLQYADGNSYAEVN